MTTLLDPAEVRTDVLAVGAAEGPYRTVVERAGCNVYSCAAGRSRLTFVRNFLRVLREQGPYDVVHAHLQLFSGLILRLAHHAAVPVRIAHSRNAADGVALTLPRRAYRALMRRWLDHFASHRLAVSREAALGAFGPRLGDEAHCELMSGLDFAPFTVAVDRREVRHSLGISPETRVVGHVGSFTPKKNHAHLLRVAFRLFERHPDVRLLSVGSGALLEATRAQVAAAGWTQRAMFLGDRSDVPRLMAGAMDAFVLTSLHEGLPRVLLEAQASGLPCVSSTAITREAAAPSGSVSFVDLEAPLGRWCEAVEQALAQRGTLSGAEAVQDFTVRGLTIEANARRLAQLYRQLWQAKTARSR